MEWISSVILTAPSQLRVAGRVYTRCLKVVTRMWINALFTTKIFNCMLRDIVN